MSVFASDNSEMSDGYAIVAGSLLLNNCS